MSKAVQDEITTAQQELDAANANLANNQSQAAQLQAAVTAAQALVDRLTRLNAAVDAETQVQQPAQEPTQLYPQSDPNATPAVDANGQPVEQPVQG